MQTKEPYLNYGEEIQMLKERLETSFPGVTHSIEFRAHDRYARSEQSNKYDAITMELLQRCHNLENILHEYGIKFDRAAGLNGQGGSSSPVALSIKEVKP